jgi:hypothetical protein
LIRSARRQKAKKRKGGKRKKNRGMSSRKSREEYVPYLDQLSSGWVGNFKEQDRHKQLLIQPMIIPDLSHTKVGTPITGYDEERIELELYTAPNGRPTTRLRNAIKMAVPTIR